MGEISREEYINHLPALIGGMKAVEQIEQELAQVDKEIRNEIINIRNSEARLFEFLILLAAVAGILFIPLFIGTGILMSKDIFARYENIYGQQLFFYVFFGLEIIVTFIISLIVFPLIKKHKAKKSVGIQEKLSD